MRTALACFLAAFALAVPAAAQDDEVPYWAAINVDEINMRKGPSTTYPIDWVYTRKGLPVKVLRKREGWRYVEDMDGTRGWFLGRMLTRTRTAIVTGESVAPMRAEPSAGASLSWNAEPGVVGRLGECEAGWCEFDVEGRAAWIEADRIWGDGEP